MRCFTQRSEPLVPVMRSISEISSCFCLGRDPGTLKSDIVSKKTSNEFARIWDSQIENSKIEIMETDRGRAGWCGKSSSWESGFQRVWLRQILNFQGWNSQVHLGFRVPRNYIQYTRSPSQDSRLFGARPWKILAATYETNRFLSNPSPGENLVSGNLVTETGCMSGGIRNMQ